MILILKDNNSIWVAHDLIDQCYPGMHIDDMTCDENVNSWKCKDIPNCIMAMYINYPNTLDGVKYGYKKEWFEPLNISNLALNSKKKIQECLDEYGYKAERGFWGFVFAKDDVAYVISSNDIYRVCDFSIVGEINDEDVLYGAMMLYKDKAPVDRIVESFRMHEKISGTHLFPLVIRNTMTEERMVIEK